jgi:adenylate cyclase
LTRPLARYGGRVVKTMGDGLLPDFGSAVNAVACVVEIQRSVAVAGADVGADRRIAFRFGIHIGDSVIDGEDILGDGVNIAARPKRQASEEWNSGPPATR